MLNIQKMENRLCGGTLLTILMFYKRPVVKTPISVLGVKTNLKQPDFIKGLLRIMRPKHAPYNMETFATQSSNYKNCRINGGSDVPFHDRQYAASFERRISEEYCRVAEEMNALLKAYLQADTPEEMAEVSRVLLGLIASDKSISDTEPLYALPNGDAVSKSELVNMSSVCIASMIIGTLLYISRFVPENTAGQDTLEAWNHTGLDTALRELAGIVPATITAQLEVPVVAPEDDLMSGIPDIDKKYRERFSSYLRDLHDDYCRVPSFFQNDPVEFESFYVCPNLTKSSIFGKVHRLILQNRLPLRIALIIKSTVQIQSRMAKFFDIRLFSEKNDSVCGFFKVGIECFFH